MYKTLCSSAFRRDLIVLFLNVSLFFVTQEGSQVKCLHWFLQELAMPPSTPINFVLILAIMYFIHIHGYFSHRLISRFHVKFTDEIFHVISVSFSTC